MNQAGRLVRSHEHTLAVGSLKDHLVSNPVGQLPAGSLHVPRLGAHRLLVCRELVSGALHQRRVGGLGRLRQPRDLPRQVGRSRGLVDPVQVKPAPAGGDQMHDDSAGAVIPGHRLHLSFAAHLRQRGRRADPDLVALPNPQDSEAALRLRGSSQRLGEREVPGFKEL